MPRRINFEADAVPYRRGNTDYSETSVGRRAIRTFNGADGSWKLTNLGKRYFKSNALPEVVLRIPCVFPTTDEVRARAATSGVVPLRAARRRVVHLSLIHI